MALAIVHMKSRKQIAVVHPWTAVEWHEWLDERDQGVGGAIILLCDEKGNQYVVPADRIEFVMVPLTEEK
jgi:hypothetical protein